MRIVCTVAVGNRNLPSLNLRLQNKHVKSTLALCKSPKVDNEYLLILFTAQNKNGTKYKLSNNIKSVLTKFINDGKATIQLKEPQIDLYVQADQIQLKGFLMLMKRALEGKISSKELTVSSVSVTAIKKTQIAPTKLVIRSRSELPSKGYPRTLEALHINEIGLLRINPGILQLQRLKVLDLSDNLIEQIPTELKNLPIGELNLSKNKLKAHNWTWIGGTLARTLQTINLGDNALIELPKQFTKLVNLVNINLESNRLAALPPAFGNFHHLRNLNLANNNLTFFPGTMKRLRLESLDVSLNEFQGAEVDFVPSLVLPVQSLLEISARKVLVLGLYYDSETVPCTLVDYLDNANYCVCGRPLFEVFLKMKSVLRLKSIARTCIQSLGERESVMIDCYYCSTKCFKRNNG